jgi:hypothetical protein
LPTVEHEPSAGGRDRQQVRTDRHRADDKNRAHIDHRERGNDPCRGHQDQVAARRPSTRARLTAHIRRDQPERVGRVRQRPHRVETTQHDVIRRHTQRTKKGQDTVGHIWAEISGHHRSTAPARVGQGHMARPRQCFELIGERRHRRRAAMDAKL